MKTLESQHLSRALIPGAHLIEFANKLKENNKKPATISSYLKDARYFVAFLADKKIPLHKASPEIVSSYIEMLTHTRNDQANSIRRTIIGIRQYYRFLSELKVVATDALENVLIPAHPVISGTQLTEKQVSKLFNTLEETMDSPLKGRRDLALLSLLAHEGLKASELVNLSWQDLVMETKSNIGFLHIGEPKSRSIRLSEVSLKYLLDYRNMLFPPLANKVRPSNFMFVGFKGKNAAISLPRLTRHGLKFALYQFGQIIQIDHLTAQMLRDHAISHLLARGMTQGEVMQHLGLSRLGNIARHL